MAKWDLCNLEYELIEKRRNAKVSVRACPRCHFGQSFSIEEIFKYKIFINQEALRVTKCVSLPVILTPLSLLL